MFIYGVCRVEKLCSQPLSGSVFLGVQQGFFGTRDLPLFKRYVVKVGLDIAENGMRYTHGTENFLVFLFGKRGKYEMIA